MTDTDRTNSDDVVGRAADALRRTPVPPGPAAALIASTIEALASSEAQRTVSPPGVARPNRRRELMFRMARYGGFTAAAGLLLAFLAVTLSTREAAAFAEVLENVKDAETVTFTNLQQIGTQPALPVKWSVKADKYRMEFPGGMAVVADLGAKRGLQLDPARKEAQVLTAHADAGTGNIVEDLRKVKPEDVEPAGEQQHEGRTVRVYRSNKVVLLGMKGAETTLLVDPETDLPVRIVVIAQKAGEPIGDTGKTASGVTLTFEDFDWNAPLADALFSLDVPPGYTTVEKPAG